MHRVLKMAAVVLAASLIWCLTLNAQVAAKGSVLAASAMARPDGPNAHANVAPLTQAQHQQLYDNLLALRHNLARQVPAAAAGPGTALSGASAPAGGITAAADASSAALPAPSALYIPLNKAYPVVGDGRSFTAEPSISNTGAKWFGTMNWNRAYSNNNGGAWTAIPDDSGPADAPFFCCDQDVIHDKGRDTTFWSNLYTNSNLTNGAIRIFVRNKANTGDLCSYTFDAGNVLFDYPHLGIGNDFLYLTTNNINSNGTWGGAEIWRFPLNQMSQCQGFGYNFFTWTGSVGQRVWVPARGLTDTLFLVTLENTTQNRIFSWPENSNTISWNLVNVWSSNFGAANCTYNGVNWMADTLSTSILGFQVRSVLGQDNQTSYLSTYYTVAAGGAFNHPQAYAAGNTIRIPDLALLNNADLWFTSVCTGFPDAAANARGDIGIALTVGSSSSGSGGPAVGNIGISDAFSRSTFRGWTGTWSAVASADANSSRYGDYTTMRMQDPADVGFIGATYGILLGSPNVRMVEFLRGRYAQGWQHRH